MRYSDTLERIIERQAVLAGFEVIAAIVDGHVRVPSGNAMVARLPAGQARGWGVFRVRGWRAEWVREADPWERAECLERMPPRQLRLTLCEDGAWWGQDVSPRGGDALVAVHLVEEAAQFDVVAARFDGEHWLYGGLARRAPSQQAAALRQALAADTAPAALRLPWMTTRDRLLYAVVFEQLRYQAVPVAERRIRRALRLGGAEMLSYTPQGGGFLVEWRKHGRTFRTALDDALAVRQAGFCLAGGDRQQDLTSLASLWDGTHRFAEEQGW